MKINEQVHLIRKEFQVTPVVKRYVNIYLIESDGCYLIDTGVAGTESLIKEYMESIGRSINDIKGIFLTHSHPDHIGAANSLKEQCGCKVYAPKAELPWIENIDKQFSERPIPNFYTLLNSSVQVDYPIVNDDSFNLEDNVTIKCIDTKGHSHGSMSYLLNDEILFMGDAIPVVTDIPIFVNYKDSVDTINLIRSMDDVEIFCPAWDEVYKKNELMAVTEDSLNMLETLKAAALEIVGTNNFEEANRLEVVSKILEKAELIQYAGNPLVVKSIEACLEVVSSFL